MVNWTESEKARYQQITDSLMLKGCKWLTLLAVILFPAFSFLDFFTETIHFRELSQIRFVTTLIALLGLVLIRRFKEFKYSFTFALCLVVVCSVSITLMCIKIGGFSSSYYAGVNLVILASVLVLPVGLKKMSFVVSLVIGIYILGIIMGSGFSVEDAEALVNNLYFLLATGIIGVVAAHLSQTMRMEYFDQLLQTEKAQFDLKRSRDLLQAELKSEQENVETLVNEIRDRRIELERALGLRDEFISLASHELNTPLTALKLQTLVAKNKLTNGSELAPEVFIKIVDTYDSQLQRLIRIVRDMLDISRIASGKLELELCELNLVETVKLVAGLFPPHPPINVSVSTSAVIGNWDSFKLEQVILNLITNALKYGDKKPVDVFVFKEDKFAIIEVKDQGIGISEEDQNRIFERFERAVLPREFAGLGLGLYITKQIVEAHGGYIKIISRPGEGSTFRVELPLG